MENIHEPVDGIDGTPCPNCEMGTLSARWLHDGDLTKSGPVATAECNLCDAELHAHYRRIRNRDDATTGFAETWRDRVYAWLCNRALAWIATDEYRSFVNALVAYGMSASARDAVEGNEPPQHWTFYAAKADR